MRSTRKKYHNGIFCKFLCRFFWRFFLLEKISSTHGSEQKKKKILSVLGVCLFVCPSCHSFVLPKIFTPHSPVCSIARVQRFSQISVGIFFFYFYLGWNCDTHTYTLFIFSRFSAQRFVFLSLSIYFFPFSIIQFTFLY